MVLPRFAVFHEANRDIYLQYCEEEKNVPGFTRNERGVENLPGFIHFSEGGEGVKSLHAQHQVEPAKNGKGVHIRCCFNNKYWRLASETEWWIVAAADEPEEDENKLFCTLIDPRIDLDGHINFYHVRAKRTLAKLLYNHEPDYFLKAATCDPAQFKVIDWESERVNMVLPRFAVFHEANNDIYLQYCEEEKNVPGFTRNERGVESLPGFIHFSEGGEGVKSLHAQHQVEPAKNGKGVHIRCCFNNKYWRLASETEWWIVAAADEPEEDENKLFCTLIDPRIDLGGYINFYHVRAKRTLAKLLYNHEPDYFLKAATCDPAQFRVIDWESLVKLPKQVDAKGESITHKSDYSCLTISAEDDE